MPVGEDTVGEEVGAERSRASGHRERVWILGVLGVSVVVGLVATRHGVGFGDDATIQISAGLNWSHGQGMRLWDGSELTLFPPGISAVVALGDLLGLAPEQSVRLVNVAAFGATGALAFVLLRRHVRSLLVAAVGAGIVVTSVELSHMTSSATSEPVFLAVSLAFVLVLEDLVEGRGRTRAIAAAAALTWAAFLFRYAGLALVGIGVVVALLPIGARPWRRRCGEAAAFFASSLVVPALWMLRNWSVDGTVMGRRDPSSDTIAGSVQKVLETFGEWLLPSSTDNRREVAIGIVAVLAIAVSLGAFGYRAWRSRRIGSPGPTSPPGPGDPDPASSPVRSILPLVAFTVGYTAFVIVAQVSTAIEVIGTRYLSPVLVPSLLLLVIAVDRMADLFPVTWQRAVRAISLLVLLVYGLAHVPELGREVRSDGWEKLYYRSGEWAVSDIAEVTAALPRSAVVYSNNAPGLWWSSRRQPILWSPMTTLANRSGADLAVPPAFIESANCSETYLVWFDGPTQQELDLWYSPTELRRWVDVRSVASFPLGEIYRVGPRSDTHATC